MRLEDLVRELRSLGRPVIIATDVNPPPEFVLKIAGVFNARLFFPEKSLPSDEKRQLAKGLKTANIHEEDAAGAALKAYHFYENKLRQVAANLAKMKKSEKLDEIRRLVLSGVSVNHALLILEEREAETVAKGSGKAEAAAKKERGGLGEYESHRKPPALAELIEANAELRKAVQRLELQNSILRERVSLLERGVYERIMRDRTMRKLDGEVRRLRAELMGRRHKRPAKHAEKQEKQSGLKILKDKIDLEGIVEEYRESDA